MLAPHDGPRWFPPMEPAGEPPEVGSAASEPARIANPRPGVPPSRPPVWATEPQPSTNPAAPAPADAPQDPVARAVRAPAAPEWLSEPAASPKAKKRKTRPAKLSTPKAPRPARLKPRSVAIAIATALAFGGVVAGIIALAGTDKDSNTASPAVVVTASVAASAEAQADTTEAATVLPAEACVNTRDGNLIRGNGIGSTTSGPDAIMAFEHAYYSERSGEHARAVVAPDAAVAAAPQIQAGIDTVPLGTNHCVSILDLAEGRYAVELNEFHPDKTSITYKQVVTTAVQDGRTVITAIAAATTP